MSHGLSNRQTLSSSRRRPKTIPAVAAAELETPAPLARGVVSGIGASAMVHAILLALLSLIVISQREPSLTLTSDVRFDDVSGEADDLVVVPELKTPEVPLAAVPDFRTFAPVDSVAAQPRIDLSAFGKSPSVDSSMSAGVAAVAAGIQGRVAKAGGQTGEVQFSLAWHSLNDLDLHVITPQGEHISYDHRKSRCNGALDVDMNATEQSGRMGSAVSEEPVENVRWLENSAPSGRFTILVHQYRWSEGRHTDLFQLLVNLGASTEIVDAEIKARHPVAIYRYQYIRDSIPEKRRLELAAELTSLQQREERQATAIFERGLPMAPGPDRDELMLKIIRQYPHTDASVQAMQEVKGEEKRVR